MNTRATCSLRCCVLPWLMSLVAFGVMVLTQSAAVGVEPLKVNVDPGETRDTNVGCGFNHLGDSVYELKIELYSNKYEIVDACIEEQAGDGVLWDWERDEEDKIIDIRKFHVAGVDPNKRFWVVIWAKLAPPGEGEGIMERWMSVSDLDADADTDNNSAVCPRTPSGSDPEDFAEYPGYQSPPTVPGLVIGVNDDHDEFLPGATPWGRDLDNTTADLTKEGKNYGGWSVGLAQIKVKVGVKRAPGSLAFTVPSSVRLFEGELPVGVNKGAAFLGNRTINSAGEQTFVFYAEGTAPYQEPQQLVTSYDPEGPGQGKAEDIVTVLPVRMGIDVDSDNNGTVSYSDDLIEAKPGEIGMIAPMTADPANGKPGKLRGLLSTNVAYLLDNVQTNPVVRLGKISGTTGHVCVWKVRAGQTPVLMLNTSQSSSTTTDGDGHTLFQLLGDATDHDILITGVTPGEVMLGLQLTVNGVKVAMDVVRVTVVDFMININTHNKPKDTHGIPKVSTATDIDVADIPRKMSPGGYIWVNDDNDNPANPTTIDKDDTSVYVDNDLEPFTYSISQAVWQSGCSVEVVVDVPGRIRLWQGNKSHQLSSGEYSSLTALDFEAQANAENGTLYIEGLNRGTATITFRLKKGGIALGSNSIKVTVFAASSITWRSFANNSATMIVPASPFPPPQNQSRDGVVVFPDRTEPGDQLVRDTPGVRVVFSPGLPEGGLDWELPVYVQVFDVDHYHNDPAFDPNGAGMPNDNQSPFTSYLPETNPDGVTFLTDGVGNSSQIALEVLEASVTRVIANGMTPVNGHVAPHDIQWADVAGLDPDGGSFPVAFATVRLVHHVPGNNWRIAAGCGDTLAQAVELKPDAGVGQGVALQYINGTLVGIAPSEVTASRSSETLTVWRKVCVELAHMAGVNLTQGPVNVRSVQWGNVTAKDGSILTTKIDTPLGFLSQYAYETRGIARCYLLDQYGNFNYRGKRHIRENEGKAYMRILLDGDPHFETNYVVIYDDDVDPNSVSAWQDPHPVPQAEIQPRYPLHDNLFHPDYLPAACVEPVLRLRANDRPFRLNVEDTQTGDTIAGAKSIQGGALYSVVQCLGAYQPGYERSGDGVGQYGLSHLMGQAAAFYSAGGAGNARGGSIVYTETLRDYASFIAPRAGKVGQPGWTPDDIERSTVAHEIAHLFGARHGDGGCMDLVQHPTIDGSGPVKLPGHGYSGKTLRRIMLIHPGGPDQPAP